MTSDVTSLHGLGVTPSRDVTPSRGRDVTPSASAWRTLRRQRRLDQQILKSDQGIHLVT